MKMLWVGLFLLIGLPCVVFAQVHEEWVARYDGGGASWSGDVASAIAVDDSGNVYVTGRSDGSYYNNDYVTIKYNSAGVEQWVARYNGPGDGQDEAYAIAIDNPGNIYVTGCSTNPDSNIDFATIKYNSAGVEQWVARYNGPGNYEDAAYSIAVDKSGNVYVTGVSYGGFSDYDCATIKYKSTGVEEWVSRFNGSERSKDGANSLALDDSDNIYITGWTTDMSDKFHYHFDYATIKYNSKGLEQWVARYNGPGNDYDIANDIAVDNSGNVYVTGGSIGLDHTGNYATIKYNSAGVEQWVARSNGPYVLDGETSIAVDKSGRVYVTGLNYYFGSETGFNDATIMYNSVGVEQWVSRFSGPSSGAYDRSSSIAVDNSGNVYVAGMREGDFATIKYNIAGVEQWYARYNGPDNWDDAASAIIVDNLDNVYVTGGSSRGQMRYYDYVTIKYSQTGSISEVESLPLAQVLLEPPQPNPASGPVEIRYSLPANTEAELKIYDVAGKLIKSFYLTIHQSPITSIVWDGSDDTGKLTSPGVYFCRLKINGYQATEKIVRMR